MASRLDTAFSGSGPLSLPVLERKLEVSILHVIHHLSYFPSHYYRELGIGLVCQTY